MKRAPFVAAAIAALVGIALVWRARSERDVARPESPTMAPTETAATELSRAGDPDVAEPADGPSSADVAEHPDATRVAVEPPRSGSASGAYHAECTLVGIEVDGSRAEALDGQLGVAFHGADGVRSGTFPVRDGRWRVLVPEGTSRVVVEGALLDGRRGELAVPWSALPARDGANEIGITLDGSWLLHVVDDATGATVQRVEVRRGDVFAGAFIPAESSTLPVMIDGAPSPVLVPAALPQPAWLHFVRCLVGGAGFAWRPVDLDATHRGERTIRLQRAGSLEVSVVGGDDELLLAVGVFSIVPDTPHDVARVFGAGAPLDATRKVLFPALPVGHHVVAVGVGRAVSREGELARDEVEVVAGATASLVLTLTDPPLARPVPFAGVLHVPAGYGERGPMQAALHRVGVAPDGRRSVAIEFAEESDAGARVLRFDSGGVAPGAYGFVLWHLPALIEVEIPPEGDSAAVLVVPPPRQVIVRLHDARSGAACDGQLQWFPVDARLGDDGSSGWVADRTSGAECKLVAPASALRLEVSAPGYLEVVVDVPASREPVVEVDVALQPSRGLRLRHEHDGSVVFVTGLEWPTCHALPSGERVDPDSATNGLDAVAELELLLPPGRYRVQPQPPRRYARPEPFEIEVPEVGFAEHTVHLVRRP